LQLRCNYIEVGLEQTAEIPKNPGKSLDGGAKGGALGGEAADSDLARIIAAWPRLSATEKDAIRAIIESDNV
jgi:hypothetical protein